MLIATMGRIDQEYTGGGILEAAELLLKRAIENANLREIEEI